MTNGILDKKLRFHIRKFLEECKTRRMRPTDDTVFEHIVESFEEYRRKPKGPLKQLVSKILKQVSDDDPSTSKRQRQEESDEDERIAQELEKNTPKTNSLNSALLQNYSKQLETPAKATTPKRAKRRAKDDRGQEGAKTSDSGFVVERPAIRYTDIGGIESILQEVKELIQYPLTYPEVYAHLGVEPPRGILLHGPPGTGKTMLANAIAGESGACFLKISAPEIVSGMSGESEQKVRDLFDEAIQKAPAIIFIDEIDAITPKRETSQRGMEKRIVAQLLTSTDSLNLKNTGGKAVLVIGATNRPDALDSALRRAGRFDREICIGIPDEDGRQRILEVMTKKMKLCGDFDFKELARKTPGFVGADLSSLTKEAAVIAINRIFSSIMSKKDANMEVDGEEEKRSDEAAKVPLTPEQLAELSISMSDFEVAIPKVQPSSKREGFATIPDVSWNDIGALKEVREELTTSILQPIRYPERFEQLGLTMPAGILLYGPPGCGKTLLAKAIANESGANFISIKGPELLDKYVGESERAVRQVFQRARASSPCVVFFDELDALVPKRGSESGNGVSERVVNQLLTELDGLESRRSVFVIAATNRPDIIDSAMLRPGRLDKLLYVPLPGVEDRESILRALTLKCKLGDDVDLTSVARDPRCDGFSGADLSALCREAGVCALKGFDFSDNSKVLGITAQHFNMALSSVFPSVSPKDHKVYDRMRKNLRNTKRTLASDTTDASSTPREI